LSNRLISLQRNLLKEGMGVVARGRKSETRTMRGNRVLSATKKKCASREFSPTTSGKKGRWEEWSIKGRIYEQKGQIEIPFTSRETNQN